MSSETEIVTVNLIIERKDFGSSISINERMGWPWYAINQILSGTVIRYGSDRVINKPFVVDDSLAYYINKDRKCSIRFARGGVAGACEIKRDDIDLVEIELIIEKNPPL